MDNDLFYSDKGITFAGAHKTDGVAIGDGLWRKDDNVSGVVEREQASPDGGFAARLLAPGGAYIRVLVSTDRAGEQVVAQVYDVLGNPVGSAVSIISDGQAWDRIQIPAPSTAGTYYIHVTCGSYNTVLNYSTY